MAMIIDPDVQATAQHFGIDPALIQAVVNAEGNILRAVQCSIPSVTTRQEALEVTCRSCAHAMSDFIKAPLIGSAPTNLPPGIDDLKPLFIRMWAARWAPVGVTNDPHGLNANWPGNVLKFWTEA